MNMLGRSVILSSICAVVMVSLLSARAEADERTCRESRLPPQSDWQTTEVLPDLRGWRLTFKAGVDGDQREDVLEAAQYRSLGSDVTSVTLRLTKNGKEIHAGSDVSRYWIVAVHLVPPELSGDSRLAQRRLVEDALFPAVCSEPDPSLAWLIPKVVDNDSFDGAKWPPG